MNILNNLIETLRSENISAFYEEEWRITWKDNSNIEHYVNESNVAYSANRLAWFQSDLDSQHLLRVFDNNLNFSPPQVDCRCRYRSMANSALAYLQHIVQLAL